MEKAFDPGLPGAYVMEFAPEGQVSKAEHLRKIKEIIQESNDQKAMIKQQQREIASLKERLKRFPDHSKMDYPQVGEA